MRVLTVEEINYVIGGTEEPTDLGEIVVTGVRRESNVEYQMQLISNSFSSVTSWVESAIGGAGAAVGEARAGSPPPRVAAVAARASATALGIAVVVNTVLNEDLARENRNASQSFSQNGYYNPYTDQ